MAIKYLNRLIKQAVRDGGIELYVNGGATDEPMLAFVDDVILFTHAMVRSFNKINNILCDFSKFIAFQVSVAKSSVVFSKRVHDVAELSSILGYKIQSLPIKYLRAPITGKLVFNRDCASLIFDLQGILTR